jgi:hypothetical protein
MREACERLKQELETLKEQKPEGWLARADRIEVSTCANVLYSTRYTHCRYAFMLIFYSFFSIHISVIHISVIHISGIHISGIHVSVSHISVVSPNRKVEIAGVQLLCILHVCSPNVFCTLQLKCMSLKGTDDGLVRSRIPCITCGVYVRCECAGSSHAKYGRLSSCGFREKWKSAANNTRVMSTLNTRRWV